MITTFFGCFAELARTSNQVKQSACGFPKDSYQSWTCHRMFLALAVPISSSCASVAIRHCHSDVKEHIATYKFLPIGFGQALTICAQQRRSTASLELGTCPDAQAPFEGYLRLPVPANARPSRNTPSLRTTGPAAPLKDTLPPSMAQPQDTDCTAPACGRAGSGLSNGIRIQYYYF